MLKKDSKLAKFLKIVPYAVSENDFQHEKTANAQCFVPNVTDQDIADFEVVATIHDEVKLRALLSETISREVLRALAGNDLFD